MPKKITIRTPQGEFASLSQATKALHCDRSTLLRRIETQPDLYQRVEVITPARPKPKYQRTERGVRWPISWSQYRMQDYDVREQIYQVWLVQQGLPIDTDTEAAAEAFFDEMDQYQSQEDQQELAQELTDELED